MIISDVVSEAARGPCIVLTDRKVHANILGSALKQLIKAEILHGEIPKQEQAEIIQAMEEGQLNAIVATGQLLGEGFDCKSLSTLFLTTPIKFSGRLMRVGDQAGRIVKRCRAGGLLLGDDGDLLVMFPALTIDELMAVVQVVHVRDRSATTRLLNVIAPDIPPGTRVKLVAKLPS